MKGKFSNTGHYHGTITKGGVVYTIDLTLNISGTGAEVITGTVQGGSIDATVSADLAVYNKHNPAPQAGNYNTMICWPRVMGTRTIRSASGSATSG